MQIAVLGAGHVGSALGTGWARRGHDVTYGVRDPAAAGARDAVARAGGKARAATPAEAASAADAVVVALPFPAVAGVLRTLGDLSGKVVVDVTTPLNADNTGLVVGHTTSGTERVAASLPGARVVKAFNQTGAGNMADPAYDGRGIPTFLAGDDAAAKRLVAGLASDLGFEPVDAGPLANARLLEPLAMLWIWLAYKGGMGGDFAFRLVRR